MRVLTPVLIMLLVCGVTGLYLLTSPDNVLNDETSNQVHSLAAPNALGWEDLPHALGALASSSIKRDQVADRISDDATPASRYLEGLLRAAKGQTIEAERLFDSIPVTDIPGPYLYAPYRLKESLGRDASTYVVPLAAAARQGELPDLVAARVLARTGDLVTAIEHYLASDPARWTSYDIDSFALLLLHDGVAPDARLSINGALAAGRLSEEMETALREVVKSPVARLDLASMVSPAQARMAGRVIAQNRASFRSGDYRDLLARYDLADRLRIDDETLLLLFMAAVAVGDEQRVAGWGLELNRRYPDPETTEWIRQLRNS